MTKIIEIYYNAFKNNLLHLCPPINLRWEDEKIDENEGLAVTNNCLAH